MIKVTEDEHGVLFGVTAVLSGAFGVLGLLAGAHGEGPFRWDVYLQLQFIPVFIWWVGFLLYILTKPSR